MTQEYVATSGLVDTDLFRHVVGHLASGVTIVTTRVDGRDHGMTASSVTSLSMEPPMMLACVNNAVPTAAAIERSGRYTVNVLGHTHGDLAYQFASPRPDKFAGVAIERGAGDVPLLVDAIASLECEVTEQVAGGTHSVFLGHVISATARDGAPLTYFRGGFGRFEFERNDHAYEQARDMVLSRVFAAGQVITVDELADHLDGDRARAFYALTRLAADGLVRRDPERGYVIAPFDVHASDDTFEARLVIELGVIDRVAGGGADPRMLAVARRHWEAMSRHLVGDHFEDFHAYLDANYAFHEAIVALSGNQLLISAFGSLSIKNVMVRSFGTTAQSSAIFLAVQRDLLVALENGEADAARAAARQYCDLAKARTRQLLALTGGQV
jgi:flavin reductase (DIM6/NTAB) family NADH-FMN oxidoreductase RutF